MQAIWIFFYLIVNIFFQIGQNQNEEVTLFDRRGKAIAYIAADEDRTIYMWDGTPVAYLLNKGETYHIYGFNGKHLGWFWYPSLRERMDLFVIIAVTWLAVLMGLPA